MDILKRLFGADAGQTTPPTRSRQRDLTSDEQAIERYRYLLHTAPPETIEEAHAEAFAKLTPEQRQLVLQELDQTLTPAERASTTAHDEDPRSLARLATRAEVREPGALEQTWSRMPATGVTGGPGMGNMLAGNFLGAFAGVMLGSLVADAFLSDAGDGEGIADETAPVDEGSAESLESGGGFGDTGVDAFDGLGEFGGFDDFGGDF